LPPKEKNKDKLIYKLKLKYRLVIMNDDTFEEKISFRLTRLNVIVVVGTIIILLIIGTAYIIAFTPLKEYIPGYTNLNIQKDLYELRLRADSLEKNLQQKNLYIQNIRNVINGNIVTSIDQTPQSIDSGVQKKIVISDKRSVEDSLFRLEIESQKKNNTFVREEAPSDNSESANQVMNLLFFTPLKGVIVNTYNADKKHYGIDIVAGKNEAIKSVLEGTVIFSAWTLSTGYVIAIQHTSNIISVYKHNSSLLKKEGEHVRAGEPVAIIGSTGELTSGPHLHFELWYNGYPVNPIDYIPF